MSSSAFEGPDSWKLIRVADKTIAAKPNGETTFSFEEAKAYLAELPDEVRT